MAISHIGRRVYNELRRELAEPQVLVLVGPGQVGKTTLLQHLEADARAEGLRATSISSNRGIWPD